MPQDPKLIIFGLVIAFLGSVIAAALVYLAARAKNRNDSKRDTIADRDGLIDAFKDSVELYRTETAELRTEVGSLRVEIREVNGHNTEFTTWTYRAVDVFNAHDMADKIPRPMPYGIHI